MLAGVTSITPSLIATPMILRALLLNFLLTTCAENLLVSFHEDTNSLPLDHPNSDKSNAEVRTTAEKLCQQRKQVAIKTASVCSLKNCVTHYQCGDREDVIKYGL